MVKVAEITATIVTLIFILAGVGSQIYVNWKRKSVEGLSFYFYVLAVLVPMSWSWFGFLNNAVIMGCVQAFGAAITLIVIYQFWLYRNGGSPSPEPPAKNEDSGDDPLDRWSDEGGR